MKFLEEQIKKMGKLFEKGKPLEKFYPLYEALDTFLLTPGTTIPKAPFVRDAVDLKRVMSFVVIALIPCLCMGIYNVGYQMEAAQGAAHSFWGAVASGAAKVIPIILVSYLAGGL